MFTSEILPKIKNIFWNRLLLGRNYCIVPFEIASYFHKLKNNNNNIRFFFIQSALTIKRILEQNNFYTAFRYYVTWAVYTSSVHFRLSTNSDLIQWKQPNPSMNSFHIKSLDTTVIIAGQLAATWTDHWSDFPRAIIYIPCSILPSLEGTSVTSSDDQWSGMSIMELEGSTTPEGRHR